MSPTVSRIVLFAVGSPLAIDAEESCVRAGVQVVLGVRNVAGPTYLSDRVRIVTPSELTDDDRQCEILVALFTPGHRHAAVADARAAGFGRGATIVDPTSPLARSASLAEGVYVNAGCVIAGGCELGEWVLVNRSASIGHHGRIGPYASIGPGVVLAGGITVGRGAMIGAGTIVLPGIEIGENSVVAAGSVVRDAVPAHALAGGNPCQVIKSDIAGYKGLSV